uniref:hypothetical protein n=1 Tax=uncultured Actinomyces sp. TaxID=249061 RepID=UPI0037DD895C
MKRLYSTAAALVLAGALVLPTATSAQAANSDLTVSVTLSVYNKGSVGKAFDIYDRSKQIDEGKCKSFSNGNGDYRIEFAQGDNFTRCSVFPPFESGDAVGKYYSLTEQGDFTLVYSADQLMKDTDFLGRQRDIGFITVRPLVFELDTASEGAQFHDEDRAKRGTDEYSPTNQIVTWQKPTGKVAVHGKKTSSYQGAATVNGQFGTDIPTLSPLPEPAPEPTAPDRNRTAPSTPASSSFSSSLIWIIGGVVAGVLVVGALVIFVLRRLSSASKNTDQASGDEQAQAAAPSTRERTREDKRRERDERKRAKAAAKAARQQSSAPGAIPQGSASLGTAPQTSAPATFQTPTQPAAQPAAPAAQTAIPAAQQQSAQPQTQVPATQPQSVSTQAVTPQKQTQAPAVHIPPAPKSDPSPARHSAVSQPEAQTPNQSAPSVQPTAEPAQPTAEPVQAKPHVEEPAAAAAS